MNIKSEYIFNSPQLGDTVVYGEGGRLVKHSKLQLEVILNFNEELDWLAEVLLTFAPLSEHARLVPQWDQVSLKPNQSTGPKVSKSNKMLSLYLIFEIKCAL